MTTSIGVGHAEPTLEVTNALPRHYDHRSERERPVVDSSRVWDHPPPGAQDRLRR